MKEETKIKLSLAQKGKHNSPKTEFKKGIKRKPLSEDIKNKISKSNKGKHPSQETLKKLRESHIGKASGMKGKHHSEETKEIFRKIFKGGNKTSFKKGHKLSKESIEKYKKFRKTQVLPIKDSSIELKIQKFLTQLHIEYFTHKYIHIEHGYQCDIFIPSMNLVIECDGNYWHSYPTGNDIDHIRTRELIEKGFKVLRLWEFEIKSMDLNKFKWRLDGTRKR